MGRPRHLGPGASSLSGSLPRVQGHPWQSIPAAMPLLSCAACGAAVPMSSAQVQHLRWHARLAALEARVADLERNRKKGAEEEEEGDGR
jgi:hypothetical protein